MLSLLFSSSVECLILCDPMNCSTPGSSPSLSPRVGSNSCPLRRWCHPTISSSVSSFSSCPQSFSASEPFPVNWLSDMLNHFSHVWFCNPIDCQSPGSSVHGILQTRIWESLALLQLMFPTQGLNPCFLCFLHWQAGSLPLVTPVVVVVVRLLSCVPLFATPRTAALQASLFFTISPSLLKLMSIESAIPPNHLILCLPLFFLPSIFPSIRVLRAGSSHHVAKWLELQHQSFSEYSGLVSFRIDLFGLFAVQGTLKSLLQHHSSKASILWCSAFFMVQLSHSYMTTGKTITLTRWTFVGKVMSLLLNMLSSLVIVFFQEASVF